MPLDPAMELRSSTSAAGTRRTFLRRSAGLAAVAVTGGLLRAATGTAVAADAKTSTAASGGASLAAFPIAGFEKHFFEKYTPEQTAQVWDEIGLDLELTLRPEGHIKPERAADELPVLAAAMAARKRRILVLASSFTRADDPHIERSLRAARALGITLYRHRGFRYRAGVSPKVQLADFRAQLRDIAALNRELGMQALYQNHAGADFVGGALWDLDLMLDDIAPAQVAVALDLRHLRVELGRAWPAAIRMIAPRIGSLYVKSFRWDRDRTVETPLAEGIVGPDMVKLALAGRDSLPVCIHVEYPKHEAVPFTDRARGAAWFRQDAEVTRGWLAAR